MSTPALTLYHNPTSRSAGARVLLSVDAEIRATTRSNHSPV